MEVAERAPALFQVALAHPLDLERAREVRRSLRRPRAVAAHLGAGGRLGEARVLAHERDSVLEAHVARVEAGVDDDAGGTEDARVEPSEHLPVVGEEALLAHHQLGVERPALDEERGADDVTHASRARLRPREVPVVPGVRLVDRDRRDHRVVVGLQALADLLGRRAVRWERHEEVADARVAERRRPVVRGDREHRPLERGRRFDEALLALGQGHQLVLAQVGPRPLRPVLVRGAHRLGRRGMVVVESLHGVAPAAAVAVDARRHLVHANGELLPRRLPPLAKGGGVEAQ